MTIFKDCPWLFGLAELDSFSCELKNIELNW